MTAEHFHIEGEHYRRCHLDPNDKSIHINDKLYRSLTKDEHALISKALDEKKIMHPMDMFPGARVVISPDDFDTVLLVPL